MNNYAALCELLDVLDYLYVKRVSFVKLPGYTGLLLFSISKNHKNNADRHFSSLVREEINYTV